MDRAQKTQPQPARVADWLGPTPGERPLSLHWHVLAGIRDVGVRARASYDDVASESSVILSWEGRCAIGRRPKMRPTFSGHLLGKRAPKDGVLVFLSHIISREMRHLMDLACSNQNVGFRTFSGAAPFCWRTRISVRAAVNTTLSILLVSLQRVEGAAFAAGNILVLTPLGTSTASTAISLTEYTTTGATVQTVSVTGSCTMSGSATSEGKLASSFDGSRVSWACYTCAAGAAAVATVRHSATQ